MAFDLLAEKTIIKGIEVKIIRNFSFLTLSQAGEKAVNFLLIVILARYLGVEEYGIYALAISFVGMFGNLFDGGLNFLLTREIASSGRNEAVFFTQTLLLKIIIGVIVFIGLIAAAFAMQYNTKIFFTIALFAVAALIVSFSNTFRAVFIGNERMEFEGGLAVLYRFLALIGIFFLLKAGISFPALILPHTAAALIVLSLSYYLQRKIFPLVKSAGYLNIRKLEIFKQAAPFAVGAVMSEMYFNIDSVMLSKLGDIKTVGNYNAAYRLVFAGLLLANGLSLAVYPYFAKVWKQDKSHVFRVFNFIFKLLLIISLPVSFVVAFLANDIIVFVFGGKFYASGPILQILGWTLIPLYLYHITGRTLEAIGEQGFVARTMVVGVVSNIVLNAILIPTLGARGAAIATLISTSLILLAHLVFISKKIGAPELLDTLYKIMFPFAACVATLIVSHKYWSWPVSAILSVLVYFFLVYMFKGVTASEFDILFGRRQGSGIKI